MRRHFFLKGWLALANNNIKSFISKKKKETERKSPRARFNMRAKAVFAFLTIFIGIVAGNLARIQIFNSDYYKEQAEKNQLYDTVIDAERGIIYDANGTVLAKSASVWKIYLNPHEIHNDDRSDDVNENFKKDVCRKLSEITGVEYDSILDKANKSGYKYMVVKRRVEYAEKEAVTALFDEPYEYSVYTTDSKGNPVQETKKIKYSTVIGIDPDVKRYYPYSNLASHVIGFTNDDGDGREGLENYYNEELSGIPGRIITAQNGNSEVMDDEFETVYDAEMGTSLVLTIDEVIQRYLEESLKDAYKESGGEGAYGIVMDVHTGAVKALACIDSFDLNNPQHLEEADYEYITKEGDNPDTEALDDFQKKEIAEKYPDDEQAQASARRASIRNNMLYKIWRNPLVGYIYYPGSVFKTITLAAALEENVVSPETSFTCTGSAKVASETMRCHKREGHGTQNLTEGLMNSCNPFFINMGQKLGSEKFYEYFEAFGFTEKTGIDLPAETLPKAGYNYYTEENLGIVELSSCAFGQSLQVTPIQMITAISAIANGGYLMTPYIVAKQLDSNGNVISETKPTVRRQVISEQTASTVSGMMEAVVARGTGKNAYVAGYKVAGKTGTSQKYNESGVYIASFACFAPADDPEIAVLVMIDEPQGTRINGGQICTPVAAQVVEKTLEYMGVERQYSDDEIAFLDTNTPNLVNLSVEDAKAKLKAEGFSVKVSGKGETVISQVPAYNQTIPKDGVVVLYTEQNAQQLMTTVPDLKGLSLSQANKYALSSGLNIRISGNALNEGEIVSRSQSIEPGNEVEYGTTVTVYFESTVGVDDLAD